MTRAWVSFDDVLRATIEESGHDRRMLLGPRRLRPLAYARQITMLVAREQCPWMSTTQIGRYLGGRDHTTVVHGLRAARARLATSDEYRRLYEAVTRRVTQREAA